MSKPKKVAKSMGFPFFRSAVVAELEALRRSWAWLVGWGVLLLIGGGAALVYPTTATVVAVDLFGILLLLAGAGQFVAVFYARGWAGVLGAVLCGLLYLFAGVVLLERPLLGAAGYTLFLTMLFFAAGVVRVASAIITRYSGWGWSILSGVVSILLAVMIWRDMPAATLWVIGTFVGIELIFAGWSWVMLGLSARRLPQPAHPPTA